jgi:hypothetical protein
MHKQKQWTVISIGIVVCTQGTKCLQERSVCNTAACPASTFGRQICNQQQARNKNFRSLKLCHKYLRYYHLAHRACTVFHRLNAQGDLARPDSSSDFQAQNQHSSHTIARLVTKLFPVGRIARRNSKENEKEPMPKAEPTLSRRHNFYFSLFSLLRNLSSPFLSLSTPLGNISSNF